MPSNISKKHTSFAATEVKKTIERDWSSLLPEVLNIIAKNLNEISDFVRFRAVCKAWRSSTPITDLPPQFPWILLLVSNKLNLECYSIPSNKFYTFHAPKSFTLLCGAAEGYVLTGIYNRSGDSITYQLSLLDPLNNHEIPLPDIYFDHYYPRFYPWKNQMGEYVVYCVDGYQNFKLDFWQFGQNNWCELNLDSVSIDGCRNIFYVKNMIFIVERWTGVTKAIDMFTGTLVYVIPPTEDYSTKELQFMVEASGDILRVTRSPGFISSARFDVYRLDADASCSPCWMKVTSIGDQALFIDNCGALTLRANDFARIKRNSIYFFGFIDNHSTKCEVKRMDIETGASEHLPCSIKKPGNWFTPNLHQI
ncbi:hypothetical protein LUZ61_012245 [Rhynchospora tenuis]|uniref:KIB1-4 beta-propeller domain-containing protein n=1 Tax=Rhynchospora tenuis TaxID=198213 RepID=A0AAD6A2S3_9POAL|nr:hypothetical protein LUZ61_012245 [Rhynchospora tenuis]